MLHSSKCDLPIHTDLLIYRMIEDWWSLINNRTRRRVAEERQIQIITVAMYVYKPSTTIVDFWIMWGRFVRFKRSWAPRRRLSVLFRLDYNYDVTENWCYVIDSHSRLASKRTNELTLHHSKTIRSNGNPHG